MTKYYWMNIEEQKLAANNSKIMKFQKLSKSLLICNPAEYNKNKDLYPILPWVLNQGHPQVYPAPCLSFIIFYIIFCLFNFFLCLLFDEIENAVETWIS